MAWAITSTDEAELLYEDQLIRITFSPNSFITKPVAEKIVRLVEQMHQNEAHANLVDIRQMSSMSEEAKAVFQNKTRLASRAWPF
ncbi:MAG: hypothetical protein HC842_03135 [Cytophagales bacterium]|nr:hypothetical protein [Cytophagales bacterium]